MRITCLILLFSFPSIALVSQEKEENNTIAEQQLENQSEREEGDVEDDSNWQLLEYYKKHPLNINEASEEEWKLLNIVSESQIAGLMRYKNLLGPLIDVYELQAVPGWDIYLIKKLLPFITVHEGLSVNEKLKKRLQQGDNSLIMRYGQVITKTNKQVSGNSFLGNPGSILVRYKYQYKNLLQWGVTGDKDAGEPFFGKAQRSGFDFYSVHFFVQKVYKIKSLALGDFTINMGQGLIQWQGFAFKKSSGVLNIKRQGPAIRPYSSPGEFNFHRGAGITLKQNKWELTAFASFRKLSANRVFDSVQNDNYVSSLIPSGYHRTEAELQDRNSLPMKAFGGTLEHKWTTGHIGINSVNYIFSLPIKREAAPYNLYTFSGFRLNNSSVDYSYTFKNVHAFGEAAIDNRLHLAIVNGILASIDPRMDIALLYRRINKGYQSMFSNAFTEKSIPSNENGLYGAISFRPSYGWQLDAYFDIYRFPWLSARIDAPAFGNDYLIQLIFKPSKILEMYARYRVGSKPVNEPGENRVLPDIISARKQNWRIQVNYAPNKKWTLRSRVELVRYNKYERGFSGFTDFFYAPVAGIFRGNWRIQYFETDSYNSRVYAFENDVLYSYSIPAFYNKGIHWYLNGRIAFRKMRAGMKSLVLTGWFKIAQTIDFTGTASEPGIEYAKGNCRTQVKIQFFLGWGKNNN